MIGCPRHPIYSRDCEDVRCLRNWEVEGAPTPEEQLKAWAEGTSTCPNSKHECCPDFSCCNPKLGWSLEKRAKFIASSQREREKMLIGALVDMAKAGAVRAYVTRGEPKDHE